MGKGNVSNGIKYNDLVVRILAEFGGAELIVVLGRKEKGFLELFMIQDYYVAMLASLVISVIIIEWIYRITCYLDRKFPWEYLPVKRILLQVACGVFVPFVFSFVAAAAYFKIKGVDIYNIAEDNIYFEFYDILIFLLLIIANGYYGVHYAVKLNQQHLKKELEERDKPERTTAEKEETKTDVLENKINHDHVVLIFRENNKSFARTESGEKMLWDYSITESVKFLSADLYFTISRDCIVKRDIIEKITKEDRQYLIHLKDPFKPNLLVTHRRSRHFGAWGKDLIQ